MVTATSSGVETGALTQRKIRFDALDGFECELIQVSGEAPATKGPVLLVHGAGVRANIFRAPTETNIVEYLVGHGYDVWLENWRGSINAEPNQWTLDEVARYDHPAAVQRVVAETGADQIQAIIHCQGSTSFMMSAAAGLVPEVRTIVSNAVSLHPVLPRLSRLKMRLLIQLAGRFYPYLNAQWGVKAPGFRAKLLTTFVRMTHHECNNMVCKLSSFIYGIGFPTLWRHENLDEATHDWLTQEFAHCPTSFFRQMNRSVARGELVPATADAAIPDDFVARGVQTDARFAFLAGELNRCFLPESQQRTFEMLDAARPNTHSLHVIPGYAHLDMFIGKNAARDVFPIILAELER